ncbi:hypothetical protein VTI74DRAFT_11227 [Chaetomium olivicolor]
MDAAGCLPAIRKDSVILARRDTGPNVTGRPSFRSSSQTYKTANPYLNPSTLPLPSHSHNNPYLENHPHHPRRLNCHTLLLCQASSLLFKITPKEKKKKFKKTPRSPHADASLPYPNRRDACLRLIRPCHVACVWVDEKVHVVKAAVGENCGEEEEEEGWESGGEVVRW